MASDRVGLVEEVVHEGRHRQRPVAHARARDQIVHRERGRHIPGVALHPAWRPPEASYLAWLDCRDLLLEAEPADIFLDAGRVALGAGLNYGESGAGFARLNFATSPEHLSEAITRMLIATER